MTLTIRIPGPPVAQGRPRAFQRGGRVRLYDPKASREWKETARFWYRAALRKEGALPMGDGALKGPFTVTVSAFFPCAKGRRGEPATTRKTSRPDVDNIAKAALDAGNGILWADDAQVAELIVRKWVCYSGQEPYMEVTVRELEE